ncbi:MAG: hypothetical protein WAK53_10120 [Chromatiaceae bacterium]|jgi:hypothetical protein
MDTPHRSETSGPQGKPRAWTELAEEEQTRLRIAYGHYLDTLPPTCSLETKIERFRHWLAAQGVDYPG